MKVDYAMKQIRGFEVSQNAGALVARRIREMTVRDQINIMSLADRIAAAKQKVPRLIDQLMYLLALHENNAIVLYSSTLASQIPESHAANAFLVFQRGLHHFEIIRLCALWDSPDLDKESIPTVVELIDHPEIIDALAFEMESHWANAEGVLLNASLDPDVAIAEVNALRDNERQFGKEQGGKTRASLLQAISNAREIIGSAKYRSVMNHRHKHLAHSLSITNREKSGPVPAMRYGDERDLLELSLPLAEALYSGVNGAGFSFTDSREINRKNARALWDGCTFKVKE
jgi:hypothetical protein